MKVTDDGDFARAEALYAVPRMSERGASRFRSGRPTRSRRRSGRHARAPRARRVLAYPTETVYGFGGAIDRDSVDALDRAQGPPEGQAVPAAHRRQRHARRGSTCTCRATRRNLAARHWPGPLTLVLPGGERRVPEQLRGPEGGIAVRWTSHAALQRLIRAHGDAITSTSANRPGVPPAMSAREIREQWSDAIARGTLRVLDGGTLDAVGAVDGGGLHRPRVRASSGPARSRPRVLRESAPDLIGDA